MSESLPIQSIHHVELVVGNAKQAAYYYRKAFGFSQIAYKGPETGHPDRASYALEQGRIRLVLTTAMQPEHPFSEHLKQHGDGVRDIAFEVEDVDAVFAEATKRGAKPAVQPRTLKDAGGEVRHAAVHTYGDTLHSFYSTASYDGPFLPGYRPDPKPESGVGLELIDHIVGNVEDRKMDEWVDWYGKVFGFERFVSFDDKEISTEFTSLRSTVVASPNRKIKFPIHEPATIRQLRERGIEFLHVPDTYYADVWDRVGEIKEDRDAIKKANILVDRDDDGYLLQLFTEPVEDRPTLFFEIIQRRGAQSFGKGNFKALFESIERAQAARGNL